MLKPSQAAAVSYSLKLDFHFPAFPPCWSGAGHLWWQWGPRKQQGLVLGLLLLVYGAWFVLEPPWN